MVDTIEYLNERDDVEKTEYQRRKVGEEHITVELWHDPEGLQAIFQKAMDAGHSPRGIQEFAKERALAVRETRLSNDARMSAMYPDIVEQLKEEADGD
jgi:hypothetical protein